MKNIALLLLAILFIACPSDDQLGKSLCIVNNSGQEMYFWYSKDYTLYHYPDISLQIDLPLNIRGAGSGGCVGASEGHLKSWEHIYSQLPEGKFSVYFFETRPETQEEWDELRNNMEELVYRKDTTFEELKANDYTIEYP